MARSYHDLEGINDWRGYDIRLGLSVDGARTRDRFTGGSRMSDLAWNLNGRLGSICLVEPDGKTRGACLDGDGSVHIPGQVKASNISTTVVSASIYIDSPQYGTSNHHQMLSQIMATRHAEGDRLWCHNCLNHAQAHGLGTGRWIYLDGASVWRSDDGWPAKD